MRTACGSLGIATLLLAACASGVGPFAGSGRRIEIEMKGFTFTPRSLELEAGQEVTLVLRNTDTIEHEFMAGRDALDGGGYKQDLLALFGVTPRPSGDHPMGHAADAVAVRVAPGRMETISFRVPGAFGRYEIGCFVAGHYEAGMRAALTIEVPGAPRESGGLQTSAAPRPVATLPPQERPSTAPTASGDHDMDMEGH